MKFQPAVQHAVTVAAAAATVGVCEEGEPLASRCEVADILAAKNVGHVREAGAVLAGAELVAKVEAAGTELGAGDLGRYFKHNWVGIFNFYTSDHMQ